MGLMYHEFSWEYAEPRDQENKNCMPCLFIRFGAREEGERVTKMLQVFSREVKLRAWIMKGLDMSSCVCRVGFYPAKTGFSHNVWIKIGFSQLKLSKSG